MSIVTDPPAAAAPAVAPPPMPLHLLDLSGLPLTVVIALRELVDALRREAQPPGEPGQPLRGMFAEPGKTLPKDLIDELRRECWEISPKPAGGTDPGRDNLEV